MENGKLKMIDKAVIFNFFCFKSMPWVMVFCSYGREACIMYKITPNAQLLNGQNVSISPIFVTL